MLLHTEFQNWRALLQGPAFCEPRVLRRRPDLRAPILQPVHYRQRHRAAAHWLSDRIQQLRAARLPTEPRSLCERNGAHYRVCLRQAVLYQMYFSSTLTTYMTLLHVADGARRWAQGGTRCSSRRPSRSSRIATAAAGWVPRCRATWSAPATTRATTAAAWCALLPAFLPSILAVVACCAILVRTMLNEVEGRRGEQNSLYAAIWWLRL